MINFWNFLGIISNFSQPSIKKMTSNHLKSINAFMLVYPQQVGKAIGMYSIKNLSYKNVKHAHTLKALKPNVLTDEKKKKPALNIV